KQITRRCCGAESVTNPHVGEPELGENRVRVDPLRLEPGEPFNESDDRAASIPLELRLELVGGHAGNHGEGFERLAAVHDGVPGLEHHLADGGATGFGLDTNR